MDTTAEHRTATDAAATYFRAWRNHDWDALRAVLADDVIFRGPLGTAEGADTCVEGLRGMSTIMTDVEVRTRVADGADVITWFHLHTSIAPPAPTANWSHVEDGRITAIRVAFDPRELLAAG